MRRGESWELSSRSRNVKKICSALRQVERSRGMCTGNFPFHIWALSACSLGPDRSCRQFFRQNIVELKERKYRGSKISRCWVKSMPDTWISLFLTRSAGHTAQDKIRSPKYHWDSLSIDMILEELRDTCLETRVEKPTLPILMNVLGDSYGKRMRRFRR